MVPEGWSEKKLGSILERVAVPVIPGPDTQYRQIGIRSHGKGIIHKEAVFGKALGNKRVFKDFSRLFCCQYRVCLGTGSCANYGKRSWGDSVPSFPDVQTKGRSMQRRIS